MNSISGQPLALQLLSAKPDANWQGEGGKISTLLKGEAPDGQLSSRFQQLLALHAGQLPETQENAVLPEEMPLELLLDLSADGDARFPADEQSNNVKPQDEDTTENRDGFFFLTGMLPLMMDTIYHDRSDATFEAKETRFSLLTPIKTAPVVSHAELADVELDDSTESVSGFKTSAALAASQSNEQAKLPASMTETVQKNVSAQDVTMLSQEAPTTQATATPLQGSSMPTVSLTDPAPVTSFSMPTNAPLGSADWQVVLGKQLIVFSKNEIHQAELRLHPEELGSLHIQLKVHEGQAQLQIASMHSHVRAILESAIPNLRIALSESGINLDQANINTHQGGTNSGSAGEFAQQGRGQSHSDERGASGLSAGQEGTSGAIERIESGSGAGVNVFV